MSGYWDGHLWHDKPLADTAPPFIFEPDPNNFWETKLTQLLNKTNSLITMDKVKNFVIQGDGVRLRVPFDSAVLNDNDQFCIMIINGIHVSLAYRETLGY